MMEIKLSKIPAEMSIDELVSYVRSETSDKQSGYVLFVKYRMAKPEIDAKEFNKLFESAIPDTFTETIHHEFKATHLSKNTGVEIQVTKTENSVVYFVTDYGGLGSCPEEIFDKTHLYKERA